MRQIEESIVGILRRHGVEVKDIDRSVWKSRYGKRSARIEQLESNLLDAKDAFDRHGVTIVLAQGTLLGAVRDGGFFPHSVDCDLYAFWRDREAFAAAVADLVPRGFRAIRLYRKKGLKKITLERGEEIVDIKFLEPLGRGPFRSWRAVRWRYPGRFFSSLNSIEFLGANFKIPGDHEGYLRSHYGAIWRETVYKLLLPEWFHYVEDRIDDTPLVSLEFPFWPLRILKFSTYSIGRIHGAPTRRSLVLFAAGERPCIRYVSEVQRDGSLRVAGSQDRWSHTNALAEIIDWRLESGRSVSLRSPLGRLFIRSLFHLGSFSRRFARLRK